MSSELSSNTRTFVPQRVSRMVQNFMDLEASGGLVMLVAAIVALVWANSPWDQEYFDLWNTHLSIDLHVVHLDESLGHWVNDALMTIFFFLMGLEIKRQMVHGELSSPRRAALPAMAALGGMIFPALIFTAFNAGTDASDGWGIPMATDIAFAVGVLSLLGRRVPFSAKVFLLALAIADDIGAIVVIAIFYSESVSLEALGAAAVILAVIYGMNWSGVRRIEAYVVVGAVFWLAVFESGVHATLAGVALGLLTPAGPLYDPRRFAGPAQQLVNDYNGTSDPNTHQAILIQMEDLSRGSEAPLERLERALQPWVSFGIVPLFALANAGVSVGGGVAEGALSSSVSHGVALGLLIGKPVGIFLFTWLAIKFGIGEMPRGTSWTQILGMGMIGGIGFTVSLLVTSLALGDTQAGAEARLGVLVASLLAGTLGAAFLYINGSRHPASPAEEPVPTRH